MRRSATKSKPLSSSISSSMCLSFQFLNLTETLTIKGWMEIQTLASESPSEMAFTLNSKRSGNCCIGGTSKILLTKRSSRLYSKQCLMMDRGRICTFKTTSSGSRSSSRAAPSLFGKWGTHVFLRLLRRCSVISISMCKPKRMSRRLNLWRRKICLSTKWSRSGARTLRAR